ncbi:YdcF family protein [Phreatobacter sp.]|uniref:YdcF family protein n=1 Tax=Phreatobacter sp. TaxID=1966341 RepID=UPI003F71337D
MLRPGFLLLAVTVPVATVLGLGFLSFADGVTQPASAAVPRTEAIVAMTGGAQRVTDAVALLGAGHGRRLLISGVHPAVGERAIARAVPEAERFLDCCIDLDHRALNTFGNAIETARWVRQHAFRSVLVVTSAYHMPRTMLELRRQLPDVELIAHPVQAASANGNPWWKDGQSLKLLGLEYAKYLMAAVRLRLDSPVAEPRTVRVSSS